MNFVNEMKKNIIYRLALPSDAEYLTQLGIKSYSQFAEVLTLENWGKL